MPCGCGRTYIVNESYGFTNGRNKDTSFKSFITFLLVFLILLVVISCIFLTVSSRKGDQLRFSNATKENLNGKLGQTTTENPSTFNNHTTKNNDISSTFFNHTELHTKPSEPLHDKFTTVIEPQSLTTMLIKIVTPEPFHNKFTTVKDPQTETTMLSNMVTSEQLHNKFTSFKEPHTETTMLNKMSTFMNTVSTIKPFQNDLKTSITDKVQTVVTTQINPYYTVTEFSNNQNTTVVNSDSDSESNNAFTKFTKSPASSEQSITTTDLAASTERDDNKLHTSITAKENETIKNVVWMGKETTTELNEVTSQIMIGSNTDISKLTVTEPKPTDELKNVEISTESNTDSLNSIKTTTENLGELASQQMTANYVTEGFYGQTTSSLEMKASQSYNGDLLFKEYTSENYTDIPTSPVIKVGLEFVTLTSSSQDVTKYNGENSIEERILDEFTTENNLNFKTESKNLKPTPGYNLFYSSLLTTTTSTDFQDVVDIATEVTKSQNEIQKLAQDDSKLMEKQNVCTETACKEKASQILRLMDHSVDPCDDFYQFSCGGVKNVDDSENLRYVDDLLKHLFTFSGSKDKYVKSFHQFFDNCVEYENEFGYSKKIKQVLTSNVRDNNLTSLLAFLMLRQSTPLFDISYGFVGSKEGYGIQILPPDSNYETTGLNEWSLQNQIKKTCLNSNAKLKYQSEINLTAVYKDYNKCKEKTFKRMATNFVTEKIDRKEIPNNKISVPNLQNALIHQRYAKTDIENLNEKYPQIDWQDFFNKISEKEFGKSTPIYLYLEQEYFEGVMQDLGERMLRTEKEVLETLKLYYQLELFQNLLTPKQNKERFCMNQAVQLMPEIATKIFYEISGLAHFPYSLVEETFIELKDKIYWLTEVSHFEEANKLEFKNSLEKLSLQLFQDDEKWKKYLEESYESFYLTTDYLSNVFMFLENKRRTRLSWRGRNEAFVSTLILESQFSPVPKIIPNSNVLVIPNMFLHKLSTTQDYPYYITESYLKYHLTRALALHYNDIDQKYGSTFYREFLNSLNSYWENRPDIKMFKNQRISYKLKTKLWTNVVQFSDTTRMADNIALDMAFNDIYISNKTFTTLPWIGSDYSPQHQFFMLIAQEYCQNPTLPELAQNLYETPNIPSTFQIESMIVNSKAFSQTFKCPQGTPMNPEEKIQFNDFVPPDNSNYYDLEPASK